MNIDALVESFYSKDDAAESLIDEVLALMLESQKPLGSLLVEKRGMTLSWDGIPDIPISEIPWSDVKTVEGGADIQGPQRQQLMQFLDDIEGDDLKDKVQGIAKFYEADVSQLTQATKDLSPKEQISYTLGYLTFFKTLTKIIAHFNASSAGFSFEAFLGVLLGGTQIPASGADTIADLVDQNGVPISLKLYTEGQLKVGGSFTDLANDLRKYGQMQYVAVTKTLNDEKTAGRLDFYRFNFTLDNIANILVNAGLHNPEVIRLPAGFVANPAGFEDIEIPAPPKMEELVKIYEDRVKELGSKYPEDVLINAIAAVGLPEDTSMLKGQKKIFGRDELPKIRSPKVSTSLNIKLALRMGLLPEEPPPFPTSTSKKPEAVAAREEWMETYGNRIQLALDVYNNVVAAAYNDVVEATQRNIAARQELISRAGGQYLPSAESAAAYNELPEALQKKALLLSHGYVNTDQFELTDPRVKNIEALAEGKEVFPPGQDEVMLGSIEVGQDQVVALMERVSEIVDASVFAIFEDLKTLTTNIQAYFGNGLQDDSQADKAVEASESIGERTRELKDEN